MHSMIRRFRMIHRSQRTRLDHIRLTLIIEMQPVIGRARLAYPEEMCGSFIFRRSMHIHSIEDSGTQIDQAFVTMGIRTFVDHGFDTFPRRYRPKVSGCSDSSHNRLYWLSHTLGPMRPLLAHTDHNNRTVQGSYGWFSAWERSSFTLSTTTRWPRISIMPCCASLCNPRVTTSRTDPRRAAIWV